jgi:hypothetical protein
MGQVSPRRRSPASKSHLPARKTLCPFRIWPIARLVGICDHHTKMINMKPVATAGQRVRKWIAWRKGGFVWLPSSQDPSGRPLRVCHGHATYANMHINSYAVLYYIYHFCTNEQVASSLIVVLLLLLLYYFPSTSIIIVGSRLVFYAFSVAILTYVC